MMFAIIGALLTGYGALSPDRSESLGLNVNLIWGACILAFSALMLVGWKFGRSNPPASKPASDDGAAPRRPGGH
jgi:hypothetical protein